jgi:hypothetical protein
LIGEGQIPPSFGGTAWVCTRDIVTRHDIKIKSMTIQAGLVNKRLSISYDAVANGWNPRREITPRRDNHSTESNLDMPVVYEAGWLVPCNILVEFRIVSLTSLSSAHRNLKIVRIKSQNHRAILYSNFLSLPKAAI